MPDISRDLLAVEKEIVLAIEAVTQECHGQGLPNGEWTERILGAVRTVGEARRFKSRPTDELTAWLFDLVWFKVDPGCEKFEGLNLACEIQWGTSLHDILYDFRKLTVVHADHRLMVFEFWEDEQFKNVVEQCKAACPAVMGFRYLMVGIMQDKVLHGVFTL